MGDRCYVCVTYLPESEAAFEKIFGGKWWDEEMEGQGRALCKGIYEANYACWDEFKCAAEDHKATFVADAGAGGDYGPCTMVGYGGEFYMADTDLHNNPTISLSHDGSVDKKELAAARKFCRIREEVENLFGVSIDKREKH